MQRTAKEKEPLTVAAIRNAHVKQLQWGVKFIRQNLDELRAGEWLSLKEALYDFTLAAKIFPSTKRSGLSVVVEKYEEERFIQEMSPGVVQDIQSGMIAWFRALAPPQILLACGEGTLHPDQVGLPRAQLRGAHIDRTLAFREGPLAFVSLALPLLIALRRFRRQHALTRNERPLALVEESHALVEQSHPLGKLALLRFLGSTFGLSRAILERAPALGEHRGACRQVGPGGRHGTGNVHQSDGRVPSETPS